MKDKPDDFRTTPRWLIGTPRYWAKRQQRVRLSHLARSRGVDGGDMGTIVSIVPEGVRVRWDGKVSAVRYHPDYVEFVNG